MIVCTYLPIPTLMHDCKNVCHVQNVQHLYVYRYPKSGVRVRTRYDTVRTYGTILYVRTGIASKWVQVWNGGFIRLKVPVPTVCVVVWSLTVDQQQSSPSSKFPQSPTGETTTTKDEDKQGHKKLIWTQKLSYKLQQEKQ